MAFRVGIVSVLVLIATTTVVGAGATDGGYHAAVSPGVDVPDRNVTFEGDEYRISHLGRVDPGGRVSVRVEAPAGESFDVFLYNVDREILDRYREPGGETVTFDIPDADPVYPPGTYVVAVDHGGVFQAVTPVVVSGYHVRVSAPSRSVIDGSVTVRASVTTVNDSRPIDRVQAVIGDGSNETRITLGRTDDQTYGGTADLGGIPEGEYTLYVVVQGAETAFGHQELLGVSDAQRFSIVQEESIENATASTTGSDTRVSHTPAPNPSFGDGSSPPTSADSLITPGVETAEPTTTSTPGQPLGLMPVLVALGGLILLTRRR